MKNPVEQYIARQKSPQKEILVSLRNIFLKRLTDTDEKMMWGVITYAEGLFYLLALKDSVNVGFSINGLDKEEQDLFQGKGKTMRHIKIHSFDEINEPTDKPDSACR
jgi:hypothetical protein